jgi:hypothetical protein
MLKLTGILQFLPSTNYAGYIDLSYTYSVCKLLSGLTGGL